MDWFRRMIILEQYFVPGDTCAQSHASYQHTAYMAPCSFSYIAERKEEYNMFLL